VSDDSPCHDDSQECGEGHGHDHPRGRRFYEAPDQDDPRGPGERVEAWGWGQGGGLEWDEEQGGSLAGRVVQGVLIEYLRIRWSETFRHDCGCSFLIFDTSLSIYIFLVFTVQGHHSQADPMEIATEAQISYEDHRVAQVFPDYSSHFADEDINIPTPPPHITNYPTPSMCMLSRLVTLFTTSPYPRTRAYSSTQLVP